MVNQVKMICGSSLHVIALNFMQYKTGHITLEGVLLSCHSQVSFEKRFSDTCKDFAVGRMQF